jgi:hypothetical protein
MTVKLIAVFFKFNYIFKWQIELVLFRAKIVLNYIFKLINYYYYLMRGGLFTKLSSERIKN